MKYQAVIFDLFGTLIENFSRSEYAAVFRDMSEALSVPVDEFLEAWGATFEQRATGVFSTTSDAMRSVAITFNPGVTDDQIKEATRIRIDYTKRSMDPREDAIEVLTYLRESEYKVGLISDCTCEIPNIWDSTTISPFFDVVIFSCSVGVKKPDARIYNMAVEQLGVAPRDCLYIGDGSSHELTGALAVGMHPVLIRDPNESDDTHFIDREQGWNGPVISSLSEVLTLL